MNEPVIPNIKKVISLLSILILMIISLPLISIVLISISDSQYLVVNKFTFRWYLDVFASSSWITAGFNSAIVALITSLLAVLVGFMTADGLMKFKLQIRNGVLQLFIIPLITPVIIFAVAIFLLFSYLHFLDNVLALVFSQIVIIIPISISLCYISLIKFIETNPNVIHASKTMGAKYHEILFIVLFPNLKINLLLIFIICFMFSINESVITQFISDTNTVTLSKKIFEGVKYDINPEIAVISSLSILLSIIVYVVIRKISGKIIWK